MSTRRFLLNPSSTQPLLFLHTTLSHFSKGSLKLHLWSLRLRSYSDVNALNILYCPHCSFIISCNSPLINAPAGRLPPCCQSKTSKSQTSIRYMPVTLRPVGSWYPHETAASLTVTFKALHGLTWAASSLVLSLAPYTPAILDASDPRATTLTPTPAPLHVLLPFTWETLLPRNHPPPHQFHSTCYSFIRSQVQCPFCQEALSGSASPG